MLLREESNAGEILMLRNILFSRIRESLFSRKIVVFNSRKLIPIFFLL